MKIKNKYVVLKAMREILEQYQNRTHNNKIKNCSLCNLYYEVTNHCKNCPMRVFGHNIGCLDRKCKAIDCDRKYNETELSAVIEFYKEAIEKIKSMNFIQFMFTDYKFLLKIDEEIATKFKIIGLSKE